MNHISIGIFYLKIVAMRSVNRIAFLITWLCACCTVIDGSIRALTTMVASLVHPVDIHEMTSLVEETMMTVSNTTTANISSNSAFSLFLQEHAQQVALSHRSLLEHARLYTEPFSPTQQSTQIHGTAKYESGAQHVLSQSLPQQRESVQKPMKESSIQFQCAVLPTTYSPNIFCSGVVDYPFVLRANESLEMLDESARQEALFMNPFMQQQCLSDYKRLICGRVYLECVSGVIPGDAASYQPITSTLALPFKRPCVSLCLAASYAGNSCRGILEMLGAPVNCEAVDPNWNTTVYDSSNNANTCNALATTENQLTVGASAERYIGSWCTDVVSENVYIPSSALVDALLAPFLPPFVLQSILEGVFGMEMSKMPFIFPSDCLTIQRKLMCSMVFMEPIPLQDLSFIFGTIYLPSFPAHSLCESYNQMCSSSLLTMIPSLAMNCSATEDIIHMFPSSSQTILSLDFGYGPILLETPPNYLTNATIALATECPRGFGVPSHPNFDGIGWIPNTACAMACPGYLYDHQEFDTYTKVFKGANMASTLLGFGQLVNMFVTTRAKRNVFILIQLLVAFLLSFYESIELSGFSYNELLCSSSTSYYTPKHSAGESKLQIALGDNCVAYGMLAALLEFTSFWVCLAVFVELWLRVVRGIKDVKWYRRIYFWGGLLVTAANYLLLIFYGHPTTQSPGSFIPCTWGTSNVLTAYYLRILPHTIYFGVAIILSIHVVYHCIVVSTRVENGEKNRLLQLWSSYRILFLFTMLLFVFYVPFVFWFGNYVSLVQTPRTIDSFIAWTVCTFENFIRSDDLSYIDVCGAHLSRPFPFGVILLMSLLVAAENVILFVITLNSDAKQFWSSVFKVLAQQQKKVYVAVYRRASMGDESNSLDSHRKSINGKVSIELGRKPDSSSSTTNASSGGGLSMGALMTAVLSPVRKAAANAGKVVPIEDKYLLAAGKQIEGLGCHGVSGSCDCTKADLIESGGILFQECNAMGHDRRVEESEATAMDGHCDDVSPEHSTQISEFTTLQMMFAQEFPNFNQRSAAGLSPIQSQCNTLADAGANDVHVIDSSIKTVHFDPSSVKPSKQSLSNAHDVSMVSTANYATKASANTNESMSSTLATNEPLRKGILPPLSPSAVQRRLSVEQFPVKSEELNLVTMRHEDELN